MFHSHRAVAILCLLSLSRCAADVERAEDLIEDHEVSAHALTRENTLFRLVNVANGQCLDASNSGEGLDLYTWPCHGGANQTWSFDFLDADVRIRNQYPGKCADSGAAGGGVNVVQWPCHELPTQRWRIRRQISEHVWVFESRESHRCLDAANFGNWLNVIHWDCHEGPEQQWEVYEPL